MKIIQLGEQEVSEIKSLPIDSRRPAIQTLIINKVLKETKDDERKWFAVKAFTRFGKTYLAKQLVERFKTKFPDKKNYVIVPSHHLKGEWRSLGLFDEVYVINSFTDKGKSINLDNAGIVVVDEAHHASSRDGKQFNRTFDLIPKSAYCLALSATLLPKHLSFMEEKGFKVCFSLPIKVGTKLGIVPNFRIINVGVELTRQEQRSYESLTLDIQKNLKLFSCIDNDFLKLSRLIYCLLAPKDERKFWEGESKTPDEWLAWVMIKLEESGKVVHDEGSIIGVAKKIQQLELQRKMNLWSLKGKESLLIDLAKEFGSEEKILIFTQTIDLSYKMKKLLQKNNISSASFQSKVSKKELVDLLGSFYAGETQCLISIGKLKEGFTVKDCKYAIRMCYHGSQIDAQQITGRVLTFDEMNPDKESIIINMYGKPFTFNGEEYEPVEIPILENAYKGMSMEWYPDYENVNDFLNPQDNNDYDDEPL